MVLLILATGVITGASSMIIVALPSIAHALQASLAQSNWVIDAFTLSLAIVILAAGTLSDRIGLRRALLISLALLVPITAIGALATNIWILIGSRLAGGVVGALLYSAVLGHVVALWPGAARTRAIAQWGMGLGIVAMINPPLAGWLEQVAGWRVVVAVTPALAGLTWLATWRWLPAPPPVPARRADVLGCLLAGAAVAALLIGVNLFPQGFRLQAASLMALGLGLGGLFVVHGRRHADAVIPLGLAGTSAMLVAAGVTFFSAGLLFAFNQTMEHFAQDGLGYSALVGGLLFAVGGASSAVGSRLAGPLIARLPMRWLLAGGMALTTLALGFGALAWRPGASLAEVLAVVVMLALAFGLSNTAATHAMTAHTPAGQEGAASALTGLARYLGGSLGLAGLGAVLAGAYAASFNAADLALPAGLEHQLARSYAMATHWALAHPAQSEAVMAAARDSIMAGARIALWVSTAIAAAWTLCVWRLFPAAPENSSKPSTRD